MSEHTDVAPKKCVDLWDTSRDALHSFIAFFLVTATDALNLMSEESSITIRLYEL